MFARELFLRTGHADTSMVHACSVTTPAVGILPPATPTDVPVVTLKQNPPLMAHLRKVHLDSTWRTLSRPVWSGLTGFWILS